MNKRTHITVHGDVQGVSFRYYACREARRLGLTGWVRNNRDGTVEIVTEGDEKKLLELVRWCSHGSLYAAVRKVDVVWEQWKGEFRDFLIAYL